MAPTWVFDDGGRQAAGFKGEAGDCFARAVAIATGQPYAEVYALVNATAAAERPGARKGRQRGRRSAARSGVFIGTARKVMAALGWDWVPTMGIGTGCRVHLRRDELPKGRLVVNLSKHFAAVVDGVIHDTHDPSRDGKRCVYGYWTRGPKG